MQKFGQSISTRDLGTETAFAVPVSADTTSEPIRGIEAPPSSGGRFGKFGDRIKGMFGKKRKIMILVGMFVLLIVTGYLNFSLNNKTEVGLDGQTNQNLFTVFRTGRTTDRDAKIAYYQSLGTDAANKIVEELYADALIETQAENTIRIWGVAEGFLDVVVSRTNGNVNVFIKRAENIDQLQAVHIMEDLRTIIPGLDIDNVFINVVAI